VSATKLPNYGIPAYPFAAIILGSYLNKALNDRIVLPMYPVLLSAALFCIIPVAGFLVLKNEAQTTESTWIAWLLTIPAFLFLVFAAVMKRLSTATRIYGMAAVCFIFNVIVFIFGYPEAFKNNPVVKTLPLIQKAPAVVAYRHSNAGYNFYLDRPIERLDADQIDSLSQAVPGTVIITSAALLKELDKLPLRTLAIEHDNFERRETVLLSR